MRNTVIAFLAGMLIGFAGTFVVQDQRYREWRVRAMDERHTADSLLAVLTLRSDSARYWRDSASRIAPDTTVLTRWRTRIDTVLVTIAQAPTLQACQDAAMAAVTSCRLALDSASKVAAALSHKADLATQSAQMAMQADSLSRAEIQRLNRIIATAPPLPGKWLGFLPQPRLVAGLGCTASSRFVCGLSMTAGFSF